MRIILGMAGFCLFIGTGGLGLYLLSAGKLSGTEFITFVVAFAVLSLVISFSPEVQEISIAGNVVKLKEVKAEAIKAIESLNKSRIEMLRAFLPLILKHGGGYASGSAVDPRTYSFWHLVKLIREYQCLTELKDDLLMNAKVLAGAQIMNMASRNADQRLLEPGNLLDPIELAAIALSPAGIEEAQKLTAPFPTNYLEEIKQALAEYGRFYSLTDELKSI